MVNQLIIEKGKQSTEKDIKNATVSGIKNIAKAAAKNSIVGQMATKANTELNKVGMGVGLDPKEYDDALKKLRLKLDIKKMNEEKLIKLLVKMLELNVAINDVKAVDKGVTFKFKGNDTELFSIKITIKNTAPKEEKEEAEKIVSDYTKIPFKTMDKIKANLNGSQIEKISDMYSFDNQNYVLNKGVLNNDKYLKHLSDIIGPYSIEEISGNETDKKDNETDKKDNETDKKDNDKPTK